MRFQGILSAWDQDAGHGTIRALNGGDEVFVGQAAFPTDGEMPRLDEALSFEIVSGRDGRKQAVNLRRLPQSLAPNGVTRAPPAAALARARRAQKKRRLGLLAGAVVTVMLVTGGLHWRQGAESSATVFHAMKP